MKDLSKLRKIACEKVDYLLDPYSKWARDCVAKVNPKVLNTEDEYNHCYHSEFMLWLIFHRDKCRNKVFEEWVQRNFTKVEKPTDRWRYNTIELEYYCIYSYAFDVPLKELSIHLPESVRLLVDCQENRIMCSRWLDFMSGLANYETK